MRSPGRCEGILRSVKYAMVIAPGVADGPLPELEGLTPLEAARTPTADRLARSGRVGTVATVPAGLGVSTNTTMACLLGVDTAAQPLAAGPLAALGGDPDWSRGETAEHLSAHRATLAEIVEIDAAGCIGPRLRGLSMGETESLLSAVFEAWRSRAGRLVAGSLLRQIACGLGVLLDDAARPSLRAAPSPAEIAGEPMQLAAGLLDERAAALADIARETLRDHEINLARREQGLPEAGGIWLWGGGMLSPAETLAERAAVTAAIVADDPIVRGVGTLLGATAMAARGSDLWPAARDALAGVDLVVIHDDRASHAALGGDFDAKVQAIEALDREVLSPLAEHLESLEMWRLLVVCDQVIRCGERRSGAEPGPLFMSGPYVRRVVPRLWTEADAEASDLHVDPGHELLDYFLNAGLTARRSRSR